MEGNNTNWCQAVTGVVIRNGKVLLARHTYGDGKGKLSNSKHGKGYLYGVSFVRSALR